MHHNRFVHLFTRGIIDVMTHSDQKARNVERAIRLAWSSLESHLEYTHTKAKDGSKLFHKRCVKEYCELIRLLADLY